MKKTDIFFLLVVVCSFAKAQNKIDSSIEILYEKQIKAAIPEGYALCEPHLAICPNDDQKMMIGAIMLNTMKGKESDFGCIALTTNDGGQNWSFHSFPVPESADPWCMITQQGTYLFSVLGFDSLYLFRSTNGGLSWNENPINLGSGHDHQTMAEMVNGSDSKVYIGSIQNNAIFVASTSDQGVTIDRSKIFRFSNLNANTMTIQVTADGNVVIPFTTFGKFDNNNKHLFLKNSTGWLLRFNTKLDTSFTPSFITDAGGKGFPVLAIDKTKEIYSNRMYWIFSNQIEKKIMLTYSVNQGKNWTEPILVRKYTNSEPATKNSFTGVPNIIVNQKGVVGITWQDRKDDPESKAQYYYFTASLDGGNTFIEPKRVSTAKSNPQSSLNGFSGQRYSSGGDYTGLAVKKNGNFVTVWSDARDGRFALFISEIKVGK